MSRQQSLFIAALTDCAHTVSQTHFGDVLHLLSTKQKVPFPTNAKLMPDLRNSTPLNQMTFPHSCTRLIDTEPRCISSASINFFVTRQGYQSKSAQQKTKHYDVQRHRVQRQSLSSVFCIKVVDTKRRLEKTLPSVGLGFHFHDDFVVHHEA